MAKSRDRIFIVDDDEIVLNLVQYQAKSRGVGVAVYSSGEEAMAALHDEVEVVLLDLHMPKWDGLKCLQFLQKNHPEISPVVLSGNKEVEEAVEAMKLGAFDYLTKPFDPDELFTVLSKAQKFHALKKENDALKSTISQPHHVEGVVADSPIMKELLAMVGKVAPLDTTVLLTGESGVGKGMFARMIHSMSSRVDGPLVTVSCPALPRDLLESELFGHEKGAFTGAHKKRLGKIEAARGGTLFLDEIGELPVDLQSKLLNVLQDGHYYPVGSETSIKCDVRILAATNIDFEEKIAEGGFREDLYYRLSVFPVEIPPLRERLSEIPSLAEYLLTKLSKARGGAKYKLTKKAIDVMQKYNWPGNVRQLENVIERASIFADGGAIDVEHLVGVTNDSEQKEELPEGLAGIPLQLLEKAALIQTLELSGGNKAKAARVLGITEKTIYNKLKRHNLML